MFEEFLGLPLHPLAVHAPIVLVPLLVLASLGYGLLPGQRRHVTWVAAILAVVAPVSAWVAKLSGDALLQRLYQGQFTDPVAAHSDWGNRLLYASAVLGVLTLALVWARQGGAGDRGRGWVAGGLTALVVIAAVASAWFVFQVGHSGSEMVWQGR